MILLILANFIFGIVCLKRHDYVFGPACLLTAIAVWLEVKHENIMYCKADQNKWYSNEDPSIVERFLAFIFNVRTILQDGKLYLRRFYLSPRWRFLPFKIFLHHILLSDTDRALHDHPADFKSIILKNSYIEHSLFHSDPNGTEHKAGSILNNKAEWTHRLELKIPVWTLVIWYKARREWGFWPDGKFVPWYEFLKVDKNSNNYPEDIIYE